LLNDQNTSQCTDQDRDQQQRRQQQLLIDRIQSEKMKFHNQSLICQSVRWHELPPLTNINAMAVNHKRNDRAIITILLFLKVTSKVGY
jgi:hypothetical protein